MTGLPYYAHSYVSGSIDEVLQYRECRACWVYGVAESGDCSLLVDGHLRRTEGLSMFVFAPRQQITDCVCSPDFRCMAVVTSPDDLCGVLDRCMVDEQNHIGKQCYAMSHTFLSMPDGFSDRLSVYKRLYLYTMRHMGRSHQKHMIDDCLGMIFVEMLWSIDSAIASASPASRPETVFYAFCSMVETDCRVHRQVGWYAERLSITPNHLTKICRSEGMTPSEIIAFVTTRQIRRTLCDTELTIKEIAAHFHFASIDALCKYFQTQMNVSPMTYRSHYLQSAAQ